MRHSTLSQESQAPEDGVRMANGLYSTAPLKEYPAAMCDALASALMTQWPHGPSSTPSTSERAAAAECFASFLSEVKHMDCLLPNSEGEMRPDYQGST